MPDRITSGGGKIHGRGRGGYFLFFFLPPLLSFFFLLKFVAPWLRRCASPHGPPPVTAGRAHRKEELQNSRGGWRRLPSKARFHIRQGSSEVNWRVQ
jgi:hypothetical protein